MRERGCEPDLRQENRSLVFASFPVISENMGRELVGISSAFQSHFIQVTANHSFRSRLKQLTFSPYLCTVGPPQTYEFKLSHRWAESHVFASAVLSPPVWLAAGKAARWQLVLECILGCIERIRPGWLSVADRADLMAVFLSASRDVALLNEA